MRQDTLLLALILLLSVGSMEGKKFSCSSTGRTLTMFSGRTEQVTVPCKYHAVRQDCGDYYVSVTPGQEYIAPRFIVSSLYVSVKDNATKKLLWEGRTDYKVAGKYLYGAKQNDDANLEPTFPFTKTGGNQGTEDLFKFHRTNRLVKLTERSGAFFVSFAPYNPEKGPKSSMWEFACFGSGKMALNSYPMQVCGDSEGMGMAARRDELGFRDRIQAFYYDVFTTTGIAQSNPQCQEVTRTLTKNCAEERKVDAISRCYKVLDNQGQPSCVETNAVDIMDIFVNCVKFVCSNFQNENACRRIGTAMNSCTWLPGLSQDEDLADCLEN